MHDNHELLWRFLRRLGLHDADVDDALQEVIMVVAKRVESVPAESVRAFLLSTAFRVACSMRRRRGRRAEVSTEAVLELPSEAPDAESLIELKRMRQMLDEVLEAMPVEIRAVFVLYEIEGLTMSEIAGVLSIPSGTAASRLRRGREEFTARVARMEALIDSCDSQLGKGMLRAGRQEKPPKTSLPRTLAILATVAAGATSTGAATAAATSTLSWVMLVKWLGFGLLAGGTFVAASQVVSAHRSASDSAALAKDMKSARAAQSGSVAAVAPGVPLARHSDRTGVAASPSAQPVTSASIPATPSAPRALPDEESSVAETWGSEGMPEGHAANLPEPPIAASATALATTLGREIAMIDEARSAVVRADSTGALTAIARYRSQFPGGHFAPEATALEVEALAQRGDRGAARSVAERFLAAHPQSPLSQRVRTAAGL